MAQDTNGNQPTENPDNQGKPDGKPDEWLSSLIVSLAAISTNAIAVIILFFFHTR